MAVEREQTVQVINAQRECAAFRDPTAVFRLNPDQLLVLYYGGIRLKQTTRSMKGRRMWYEYSKKTVAISQIGQV